MNQPFRVRCQHRLQLLCAISILAILGATLWPFNPWPANKANWLPGQSGIVFAKPGLVFSAAPLQIPVSGSSPSCTLELLVRPAKTDSSYTILSFYTVGNPALLRITQWMNFFVVVHNVLDPRGYPIEQKFDIGRPFQPGDLLLLTLVSTSRSTVAYIDGVLAERSTDFVINPDELWGQVVLGTSAVNYAPWSGEIHGMAIYSKELTSTEIGQHYNAWLNEDGSKPPNLSNAIAYYAFSEGAGSVAHSTIPSAPDLQIPRRFTVLHKPMLKSVREEFIASWRYVNDVLRNIVGFVPVGFVFCAYILQTRNRGAAILFATLGGAALSLTVEVLQTYIPQRGSGFTDVITNTVGTLIGALLARPAWIQATLLRGIAQSPEESS